MAQGERPRPRTGSEGVRLTPPSTESLMLVDSSGLSSLSLVLRHPTPEGQLCCGDPPTRTQGTGKGCGAHTRGGHCACSGRGRSRPGVGKAGAACGHLVPSPGAPVHLLLWSYAGATLTCHSTDTAYSWDSGTLDSAGQLRDVENSSRETISACASNTSLGRAEQFTLLVPTMFHGPHQILIEIFLLTPAYYLCRTLHHL